MGKMKQKAVEKDKVTESREENNTVKRDFSKLLQKTKESNKGMAGVFGYAASVSTNGSSEEEKRDGTNRNKGFNYYPVTDDKYKSGVEL